MNNSLITTLTTNESGNDDEEPNNVKYNIDKRSRDTVSKCKHSFRFIFKKFRWIFGLTINTSISRQNKKSYF